MSKPRLPHLPLHRALIPAVLACVILPAWGEDLPEGKGKEIVAAQCTGCHTFASRVGAGYTPEGWTTVLRMMAMLVLAPASSLVILRNSSTSPTALSTR